MAALQAAAEAFGSAAGPAAGRVYRLPPDGAELEVLVDTDPLSSLLNRRGLMRALDREMGRGRRQGAPLHRLGDPADAGQRTDPVQEEPAERGRPGEPLVVEADGEEGAAGGEDEGS